jgi:hypothetical protein
MTNSTESERAVTATVRRRLTPADRTPQLHPWRRAENLARCWLYWMPVGSYPMPDGQRQWIMSFFDQFMDLLTSQFGLRVELFLQHKTAQAILPQFMKSAREFSPMAGLKRKPGADFPTRITKEALEPVVKGEKAFNLHEWIPDYCYWFLNKADRKQRELFLGYGGMSMMLLQPDSNTKPPELPFTAGMRKLELLKTFDVEGILAQGFALKDGFLQKSKELFGTGLESEPEYPGIPFVLPMLCANDFFHQPQEECDKWFQLFDVYVSESESDNGVLMASKLDFEDSLIALLEQMKKEGWVYPNS